MIDLGSAGRTLAYYVYRTALLSTNNGDLIDKYDLDTVMKDVMYVRSLSEYYKKKGDEVEPRWRYLVDLHRLNDYLPYDTEDAFYDDIKDWVQRKPIHTWNGDEEEWYRRFELAMDKVLFRSGKMPREVKTVDWFCENSDVWCTSGSGFEPESEKLKVFDKLRQELEEVKKNKWAVRWTLTKGKVKRLLFKRRKQICKAVQKSEPGKVRAVVSSDLSLYLKMSYVSLFIDQVFKGRKDSTLFMSEKDRLDLWQKMGLDGTWRMPLDQSEFDKNATKRQVMITLRLIKKLCIAFAAPADILTIMDEIIYSVDGGFVFVAGKSLEYLNGVLSGWRWTALIDTLINLAEMEMAQDWVRENSTINLKVLDLNAQGDDDWIKVRTRREAIALWLAYESFGLYVNPGKFFLSKTRDEYLRRVMDKNVVTGYPARSVTSICFRSPLSEREGVGAERVRSVFGRWKLFCERLDKDFETSPLWHMMLRDAVGGLRGSTRRIIDHYCKLGVAYGGIGVTTNYYESEIPLSTAAVAHPLDILGDGYKEWVEFVNKYGIDEREANRFAVSTLDLAGSFGVPKWIKVIFSPYDIVTKVPVKRFTGVLEQGCVFVGAPYRHYAIKYKRKFFTTIGDLKGLEQYSDLEWMMPEWKLKPAIVTVHQNIKKPYIPTKPEISSTTAQLSTVLEDVYDMTGWEEQLKHKPKSWVLDFVRGTLKTRVSPVSGWGTDVVGGYAKTFLGDAIHKFLHKKRPNLGYWDSLLASIDVATQVHLRTLPVRVVE